MKSHAIDMISAERTRQVEKESYDAAHDDLHRDGSLAVAANCYLGLAAVQIRNGIIGAPPCFYPKEWPWQRSDWKSPADPLRGLVIAGALIAAEIDRILRMRGQSGGNAPVPVPPPPPPTGVRGYGSAQKAGVK